MGGGRTGLVEIGSCRAPASRGPGPMWTPRPNILIDLRQLPKAIRRLPKNGFSVALTDRNKHAIQMECKPARLSCRGRHKGVGRGFASVALPAMHRPRKELHTGRAG